MIPDDSTITLPGGLLIAFEGIDGSGKTTMARRTVEKLRRLNYNADYLREPTDGPYGRRLRDIMVTPEKRNPQLEFELFLKDRQEDVKSNILPLLGAGGIACIDRYYISSMAYQGALGLDPDMIRRENEKFAPVPDLILYYSIPIESALQRIHTSRADGANQFEKKEYLEQVLRQFSRMDFPQMVEISADAPLEDVFNITWNIVSGNVSSAK